MKRRKHHASIDLVALQLVEDYLNLRKALHITASPLCTHLMVSQDIYSQTPRVR